MKILGNVFEKLGEMDDGETFENLLQTDHFRFERIVSRKGMKPGGEWYDQTDPEWVVLLSGSAGIRFEDSGDLIELKPGDYLDIPARCRHRVEWIGPDEEAVWLALHYSP